MAEGENHVLPPATNDSWRMWLMIGTRREPVDRRRIRGAHKGLKKLLIEGMDRWGNQPHSWQNFSGAMFRHAVDDAMHELPVEDTQLVKLAYFGGFSNHQIASWVGLTEATVQRRLRKAMDTISEYIERGRSFSRRAMYAVLIWLSGRWAGDASHHVVQAITVMGAAAIIVAQPAPAAESTRATPNPEAGRVAPVLPGGAAAAHAQPSHSTTGIGAGSLPGSAVLPSIPIDSLPSPPVTTSSVSRPPVPTPPLPTPGVPTPPVPTPPSSTPPLPTPPLPTPPLSTPPLPTPPLPTPPLSTPPLPTPSLPTPPLATPPLPTPPLPTPPLPSPPLSTPPLPTPPLPTPPLSSPPLPTPPLLYPL